MKIKTAMLLLRLEFKRKAGKDMLNMWCWTLDHSWQALPRLIFCLQTSQVPRHVVLFWTPLNSPSRQLRLLQRAAAVSLNGSKCCHCRLPYCLTFCFLPLFHICPARSRLRGFRWTLIFKELKERMRFEVVSRVLKFFFLIPRFKDLNELHTTHFSLKRNDTIMNNLAPITKRAGGAERRKCHVLHTVTIYSRWTAENWVLIPCFSRNHLFVPKLLHEAHTNAAKLPTEVKRMAPKSMTVRRSKHDKSQDGQLKSSETCPFNMATQIMYKALSTMLYALKVIVTAATVLRCVHWLVCFIPQVKTGMNKMAAPTNTGTASCTWKVTVAVTFDKRTTTQHSMPRITSTLPANSLGLVSFSCQNEFCDVLSKHIPKRPARPKEREGCALPGKKGQEGSRKGTPVAHGRLVTAGCSGSSSTTFSVASDPAVAVGF